MEEEEEFEEECGGPVCVEMVACSFLAYCDRCGIVDEPWVSEGFATLVRRCAKVAGAEEAWTRKCLSKARRASCVGEALETVEEFVFLCTPERLLMDIGRETTGTAAAEDLCRLAAMEIRRGTYDAVTRTVLKRAFRAMNRMSLLADAEKEAILIRGEKPNFPPFASSSDDDGVLVEPPRCFMDERHQTRKMWLGVSVAAVGGGTLLALTGGTAAPSLAASLLGGATAIDGVAACITGVFGALGAGISGFKARRRFAPAKHSHLESLRAPRAAVGRFFLIPGWADPDRDIRDAWTLPEEETHESSHESSDVLVSSGKDHVDTTTSQEEEEETTTEALLAGKKMVASASWEDLTSVTRRQRVDWWWEVGSSFETAEIFVWEATALERLFATMKETTLWIEARDRAASVVVDEILRRCALGAASMPIWLLERAAALDDPWAICIQRAKRSGLELAEILISSLKTPQKKPVTLVGYSIGARVLMHALEAIDDYAIAEQDHRALGLVENAIFLGAPLAARHQRWLKARRVVSGRLVNGYSTKDWMLRLTYRSKAWSIIGVAGAEPVLNTDETAVVENLDLSDLVNCHLAYPHLMQPIFARLNLEDDDEHQTTTTAIT